MKTLREEEGDVLRSVKNSDFNNRTASNLQATREFV